VRALHRVDVPDVAALERGEVDGLAQVGGEAFEHGPCVHPYVELPDRSQADLDQRRARQQARPAGLGAVSVAGQPGRNQVGGLLP
jgi:hypothetical protein